MKPIIRAIHPPRNYVLSHKQILPILSLQEAAFLEQKETVFLELLRTEHTCMYLEEVNTALVNCINKFKCLQVSKPG